MATIIHLQTQIQTTLVEIDDDGNTTRVLNVVPMEGKPLTKFNEESFLNAFREIKTLYDSEKKRVSTTTDQGEAPCPTS